MFVRLLSVWVMRNWVFYLTSFNRLLAVIRTLHSQLSIENIPTKSKQNKLIQANTVFTGLNMFVFLVSIFSWFV